MLNSRVEKALNGLLNAEIAASQRYLGSAAYCHDLGLHGFAAWFLGKVEGSRGTAMHYLQYISERGGKVVISGQDSPSQEFKSVADAVKDALLLEEERNNNTDALHDLAGKENDRPTSQVLEKFVISTGPARIQGIKKILHYLDMTQGNNAGLIMLDQSLAG